VWVRLGFAALLLWAIVGGIYYVWALTFDLSQISSMPERSVVYDYKGNSYSRLAGENRVVVDFDHVSNHFINALLVREDSRFYKHIGIDPIGIARAFVKNLLLGSIREGASTITQQLARNSFPLGGKTYHRKLLEAALAFRIETELTKEEILTAYVNRIYFGSGCYGIESASQTYFGKPASRLDLSESALIAGLIRSPTRFSPRNDLERSIRERNTVLKRMHDLGFIDDASYASALSEGVRLANAPSPTPQENWAMDAILRDLENVVSTAQMEEGGLKIYTSIDGTLQSIAEKTIGRRLGEMEATSAFRNTPRHPVAKNLGSDVVQAAAIAIDNASGGIRCIVGGRDYADSKFHRALYARRQVGSTAKPFVYAGAFEAGLKPGQKISDAMLSPHEIPRKYGVYQPANSDRTYGKERPLRDGLIYSRNTMTVRVGMMAGIDRISRDLQQLMLLNGKEPRAWLPSIFLGAFEASLKDLTAAYTVFPTDGVKLQPFIIERVVDSTGATIYRATHGKIRVFSPSAVQTTNQLLEAVMREGTGASARSLGLRQRAAGKTGTTDQFADAWFVGYDKSFTCGVWVGFDLPQPIMYGGYASGVALPIWVDIMRYSPSAK